MAEVLAVIGLAAAIAQFVDYGTKLVSRLDDIATSSAERPYAFVALKVRLPAVLAILSRIQTQIERDGHHVFDPVQAAALAPLVDNTLANVKLLLAMLEKSLPPKRVAGGKAAGASALVARYLKAVKSLSLDAEVQKVSLRLQDNLQILALVQTTSLVDVAQRTASAREIGIAGPSSATRTVALARQDDCVTGTQDGRETFEQRTEQASLDIKLTLSAETPTSDEDDGITYQDETPDSEELDDTPHQELVMKMSQQRKRKVIPLNKDSNTCSKSCSCICHRPYQLSTPTALVSLIGHLSVNYAGQAFVKVSCTEKKCKRLKASAAQVTYRFPGWALGRVIHMAISSSALNTKVNLNTMRVLPDTAEVFSVVSAGDLTRLRDMFKQGEASIYDVSRSNWTLVHSAFTLGKSDVCKFLIAEGADLSIDAANGSNVIERAWFMAQKLSKNPGEYVMGDNEILQEVDLDDFVSSQQYNLIHKIVLGISKVNLADVLTSSTAEIDGTDVRGATPLVWAAAQGNIPAIRTLLEYGANPKVKAAMAQTPLHVARNALAARLLLQYHAEVDARDSLGRTPLHRNCYRQVESSPLIIKEILQGGASVDAVAYGGQTALHYAAMFGNASLIPVLLEHGATINATKHDGLTPLMSAIRYDQPHAVKCLVERNADWTIPNGACQTVLHMVARYAGPEVMRLVAELDFEEHLNSNLNSRDNKGLTAEEYFAERNVRSTELENAFDQLMLAAGTMGEKGEESADTETEELDDTRSWVMPGSFGDA